MSKSLKEAQKRYNKKCKHISLKLNMENPLHKTAYDILERQKSKQDYIVQMMLMSEIWGMDVTDKSNNINSSDIDLTGGYDEPF